MGRRKPYWKAEGLFFKKISQQVQFIRPPQAIKIRTALRLSFTTRGGEAINQAEPNRWHSYGSKHDYLVVFIERSTIVLDWEAHVQAVTKTGKRCRGAYQDTLVRIPVTGKGSKVSQADRRDGKT